MIRTISAAVLCATASMVLADHVSAQTIVIDDFNSLETGAFSGLPTAMEGTWQGNNAARVEGVVNQTVVTTATSAIGGFRTITFDLDNPIESVSIQTGALSGSYAGEAGVLSFSPWFRDDPAVNLLWDAGGAGLNADLTGTSVFTLRAWVDHLGFVNPGVSQDIALTLVDTGGNSATHTLSFNVREEVQAIRDFNFAATSFSGVDFSDIASINLNYEGDQAHDAALFSFMALGPAGPGGSNAVVPEPATWAMMLAGFALAGLRLRRQQKC